VRGSFESANLLVDKSSGWPQTDIQTGPLQHVLVTQWELVGHCAELVQGMLHVPWLSQTFPPSVVVSQKQPGLFEHPSVPPPQTKISVQTPGFRTQVPS